MKNPGPSLFGSSGLVALRLAIGIGLMCHGYATLFGSEAGTAPLAGMLKEKLGMPQPELMAAVAKWTELVGGAMLALGLLSRLAALVVTINMIVAVYVHAVVNSDPFFRGHGSEGGSWELAALYLAGAFCILTCGAGKLSVDEIVFGDDEETPPVPPMLGDDVRRILDDREVHDILVVGDLMLDRYVWGEVDRISPEAPIPVLRISREEDRLGGAASVAHALARLGCRARLAGVVGADAEGARLRALLNEVGVDGSAVVVDQSRPTVVKQRQLARGQQVLRVDREEMRPLDAALVDELVAALSAQMAGARAVVISDYGKGVIDDRILEMTMEAAAAAGVPVLVDPKRASFSAYRGAALVTPNRSEAARAAGQEIPDVAAARQAAQALVERHDLGAIAITLDRDGIVVHRRGDSETSHLPTRPREVIDVTGAGDMVMSIFALAVAGGHDLLAGATLANLAGGLVVSRVGVVTLSRLEIIEAASHQAGMHLRKLVGLEDCVAIRAARRERGQKIALVCGPFELLLPAHVDLLRRARERGDVLVVGLYSDALLPAGANAAAVRLSLTDRARLLAALEDVDYVIEIDADPPVDLIARLGPDEIVDREADADGA